MFTKRIFACSTALAAIVSVAHADPEAHEKLMQAAEAVNNAQTLSYVLEVETEGMMSSLLPKYDVQVIQKRDEAGGWQVRREGQATMPGKKEATGYLVITTPTNAEWIDHEKKIVYERNVRSVKNERVFTLADFAWLPTLASEDPFKKDIEAPESSIERAEEIDGVLCTVIKVDDGDDRETRYWYLGAADNMPRKLEIVMDNGDLSSTRRFIMSDVQVDAEVDSSLFSIPTPPSYTEQRAKTPPPRSPNDGIIRNGSPITQPQSTQTIRRPAPEFALKDAKGNDVTLGSKQGRVVVLVFGGTWWQDWTTALEDVQELHEKYKDKGVDFLVMSVKQRDPKDVTEVFKNNNFTFGLALGADKAAREYNVRAYPTFVIVDSFGHIYHEVKGYDKTATKRDISEKLDEWLANPVPPPPTPVIGEDGIIRDDGNDIQGDM